MQKRNGSLGYIKTGLVLFSLLYVLVVSALWVIVPIAESGCNPPDGESECCEASSTTTCFVGSITGEIEGDSEVCPGADVHLSASGSHDPGYDVTTTVDVYCNTNITTNYHQAATPSCNWSIDPSVPLDADDCEVSFTPTECGTYTVTVVFEVDECTNTLTVTATHAVVVNDVLIDSSGSARTNGCEDGAAPDPGSVTIEFRCDSDPLKECVATNIVGDSCEKIVTYTFKATDACGQDHFVYQVVTVVDTNGPVFDEPLPADITLTCATELPELPNVTATDVCGSGVTIATYPAEFPASCGGVVTNTWVATDDCGNSTTQQQVITIKPQLESVSMNPPTVKPGESSQGEVSPCEELEVEWEIVGFEPENKDAQYGDLSGLATIDSDGTITVSGGCPNGLLTVQATIGTCSKTTTLEVDCSCGCTVGSSEIDNGCVHVKIRLGKAMKGASAGSLMIHAEKPSPELATPAGLSLSSYPNSNVPTVMGVPLVSARPMFGRVEAIYDTNGIRQVWAPECLADIIVETPYRYRIDIYRTGGSFNTGYAVPFRAEDELHIPDSQSHIVSYVIENPNGASHNEVLDVIEQRNGESTTNRFTFYPYAALGAGGAGNTWSLQPGGNQVHTRSVQSNATHKIVTRRIADTDGNIAEERTSELREFPWGYSVVKTSIDTDDGAVESTRSYYENSEDNGYGRAKLAVETSGSWTRWDAYDNEGRPTTIVSSWGNAGTNAAASSVMAVYHSYAPVDAEDLIIESPLTPRTTTTKLMGATISKTFSAYYRNASNQLVEVREVAATVSASYGDSGNRRTETVYNPDDITCAGPGRIASVVTSDGKLDTYTYECGLWSFNASAPMASSFAPGTGSCLRITIDHGTTNSPAGVANRTTRDVTVEDGLGRTVLKETHVYTGTGYELLVSRVYELDDGGHVTKEHRSDGTRTEATWGCCGIETETDANGLQTSYSYDDLDRVEIIDRELGSTNIFTTYTYDAVGRRLSSLVQAGGLSQYTTNRYDLAGRMTWSQDSAGIETTYDYSSDGLSSTVTRADVTNTTGKYLDGRTHYAEVNGGRKQTYDYGVNTNGTQWTMIYAGPDGTNSPSWTRTTTDMLGRTIKTERPGFGGTTIATERTYNTQGQLTKTTITGSAPTLYEYNEIGEQIRTAQDINDNGVIDLAGPDRVSASDTSYQFEGADWWRLGASILYPETGSSDPVTNSVNKTRLTGLGQTSAFGILTSEAIARDIRGNETIQQTHVDRANRTVTQVMDTPDSTNAAVTVTVNGLVQSSESKTGVTTTYGYDALGRRTSVTDGRGNTSTTAYNDRGQVAYTEDTASHRTSYAYDAATARRIAVTNAIDEVTYYHYSPEGQLLGSWGNVYPVFYAYDAFDRMSEMYTYRGTNEISSVSDFESHISDFDRTQWLYDEATGLLTNKLYADNQGPSYTYTADGKLQTREWARGITTTYAYDTCCGALTNISYSDGTPSVAFTYNRMGQQDTITDATGTRMFNYNDDLQLETETNVLGVIGRSYDSFGRASGFALNPVDPVYHVQYAYSDIGRVHSVSSSVASASSLFNYSYLGGTDMLSGYAGPGNLSVARAYEQNRNLITSITNSVGSVPSVVSSFSYQNDQLGRRTKRVDTLAVTNTFGYNARSEVVEALMGTNTYDYSYDPIGNRLSEVRDLRSEVSTNLYGANELNQYTNISSGTVEEPTYDADGNMLTHGDWTFTWNGENRLITASNSTHQISYSYDYMGRRFKKVVDEGSTITTNTFTYDGWALIQEVGRGVPAEPGYTNHYVYGLDLSGSMQGAGTIGGLLSTIQSPSGSSPETYFYFYDANGNVTDLVDTNGTSVAHYEYGPFGQTTVKTGTLADDNPFRFSTKYLDDETALYYYGYRFYLPELGRWVSRDPVEERGGLSLYAFVRNSPVIWMDSNGLWILDPVNPGNDVPPVVISPPPPGSPGDGAGGLSPCEAMGALWDWITGIVGPGGGGESGIMFPFMSDEEPFVYAGLDIVHCCDTENCKHKAMYKKECRGFAAGFSVGAGVTTCLDGENCPEGWEGFFLEIGYGNFEISLPSDSNGIPENPFAGNPAWGGLCVGVSVKVAVCEYEMITDEVIGSCE